MSGIKQPQLMHSSLLAPHTQSGHTALHLAAQSGSWKAVATLLRHDANPHSLAVSWRVVTWSVHASLTGQLATAVANVCTGWLLHTTNDCSRRRPCKVCVASCTRWLQSRSHKRGRAHIPLQCKMIHFSFFMHVRVQAGWQHSSALGCHSW